MASIIESFDLYGTMPNFTRDKLNTLEELRNVNIWSYDVGHIVYCSETKKHYIFRGNSVEFDEEIGYFRELVPDTSLLEDRIKANEDAISNIEIPDTSLLEDRIKANEEAISNIEIPDTSLLEDRIKANEDAISNIEIPDISPLEDRIKANEEAISNIEIPDTSLLEDRIKANEDAISNIEIPDIAPLEDRIKANEEAISNIEIPDITPLEDQIEDNTTLINILYNREFPITSTLSVYDTATNAPVKNIYKVGTSIKVKLLLGIKQNNVQVSNNRISKLTISLNNNVLYDDSPVVSYTIESEISSNSAIAITYTLTDGTKVSSNKSINFSTESYFGVVSEDTNISNLVIQSSESRGLLSSRGYTAVVTQDNQKNYYAYPASYGKLTSIKDDKNYELINSYEYGAKYVDGVNYNIYILKYASTVEKYKLVFS
jgi:hypothetical protein